jgi:hypothetical protein
MTTEKHLYVVLSKSPTTLSKIIGVVKNNEYTHAALALDENLEYMFSFGRRCSTNPFFGCFKRERIGDALIHSHAKVPGIVIEMTVSTEQYENVTSQIETFLLDGHLYGYNYLGLIGNWWGISHPFEKRFFCSEFVYHVLHESGICNLEKSRGLVSPQDLANIRGRIIFKGNLREYGLVPTRVLFHIPNIFHFAAFKR